MATVTVNVEGTDSIIKRLESLVDKPGLVKAGILEGGKNGESTSVLDYAPIQEFGGKIPVTEKMRGFLAAHYGIHLRKNKTHITIPPRSFLRTTFLQQHKKWLGILAHALQATGSAEKALGFVGATMQDDIIAQIKSSMPPENSAMTTMIKEKEAPEMVGRTLQFTGTLVKTIDYKVELE